MPAFWVAVVEIILAVVAIGLAIYQALQKPPAPPVPTPEQLSGMPIADQGKPIPVLFGTRIINQPNVVWFETGKPKTLEGSDQQISANGLTLPQKIMVSPKEVGA